MTCLDFPFGGRDFANSGQSPGSIRAPRQKGRPIVLRLGGEFMASHGSSAHNAIGWKNPRNRWPNLPCALSYLQRRPAVKGEKGRAAFLIITVRSAILARLAVFVMVVWS